MLHRWRAMTGWTAAALLLTPAIRAECPPGVVPQPEVCNCYDDDCDGTVDEDPDAPQQSALCVTCMGEFHSMCMTIDAQVCQCGSREHYCLLEFSCPPGETASVEAHQSGTDAAAYDFCFKPVEWWCVDCGARTVLQDNQLVECAPEGTVLENGWRPPVCRCRLDAIGYPKKSSDGCHSPCWNVSCPLGGVCTDYGPNAGRCVIDNCFNVPCDVDKACDHGACVDNPCKLNTCAPDQACKPSPDFSTFQCEASCASILCAPPAFCKNGACVEPQCSQTCDDGAVCSAEAGCVPDPCTPSSCPDGAYCDSATGTCGNWPCEGVVCPAGQVCTLGECVAAAVHDAGMDGGDGDAQPDADDANGQGGEAEASTAFEDAGFFDVSSGGANHSASARTTGGCTCSIRDACLAARTSSVCLALVVAMAALRRRSGSGRRARSNDGS